MGVFQLSSRRPQIALPNYSCAFNALCVLPGPKGVQHWSKSYPFCGGVFQSPIDLQTPLLQYDPSLVPIEVHNYDLLAHEQLTLGNSGHAVKLSIALFTHVCLSTVKLYLPSKMYILGLPNRYSAVELHVHWGSPNTPAGSEHTIDGKRFAAELHVVHFNSKKYSNVSVAADKSDGLAVLAVLIEVGEFNPAFDQLLKFINDQKVQVPAFNIRHLLPLRLDQYYRYDGSLTTPPCYPSVLWTVFRNPITISHTQVLCLQGALSASFWAPHVPPPQPRDGRSTTAGTFSDEGRWEALETSNRPGHQKTAAVHVGGGGGT
uniref:Carbonic anhydrase n=1 Tax=Paramormyrops kingsleyae TaxID=1676925 RepID=A0A3B3R535_9TELE